MANDPLVLGAEGHFEAIRRGLADLAFTAEEVCRRVLCPTIFEFQTREEGRQALPEPGDAVDLLIRLLMDGEEVDAEQAADLLPESLRRAWTELAFVRPSQPGRIQAQIALYPVESLYIASDRQKPTIRQKHEPVPEDIVYAAITRNTSRFLRLLPKTPCGRFLDLCSGTGIAALVAGSGYAAEAWSCDLGARCVLFAEFNCRLNGLGNVRVVHGDLYEPVAGLRFDRVVAHPPYVPAKETRRHLLFRDGGEDGEQILQRVIEGAVSHLNPGGRIYCQTQATDREGETIEQRVRRWLGTANTEFDIFVIADGETRWEKGGKSRDVSPLFAELWDALRVTTLFYGAIVIQRHARPKTPVTARRQRAREAADGALEWLLDWETGSSEEERRTRIAAGVLRCNPEIRLQVTHTLTPHGLQPTGFGIAVPRPFIVDAACQPWVAMLLGASDGRSTAAEIYRNFRQQEILGAEMGENEFLSIVDYLISHGVILLDGAASSNER